MVSRGREADIKAPRVGSQYAGNGEVEAFLQLLAVIARRLTGEEARPQDRGKNRGRPCG
jgi:hypothetical protein